MNDSVSSFLMYAFCSDGGMGARGGGGLSNSNKTEVYRFNLELLIQGTCKYFGCRSTFETSSFKYRLGQFKQNLHMFQMRVWPIPIGQSR